MYIHIQTCNYILKIFFSYQNFRYCFSPCSVNLVIDVTNLSMSLHSDTPEFKNYLFLVIMCVVCGGGFSCALTQMWSSEDSSVEWVLSFNLFVGSGV